MKVQSLGYVTSLYSLHFHTNHRHRSARLILVKPHDQTGQYKQRKTRPFGAIGYIYEESKDS